MTLILFTYNLSSQLLFLFGFAIRIFGWSFCLQSPFDWRKEKREKRKRVKWQMENKVDNYQQLTRFLLFYYPLYFFTWMEESSFPFPHLFQSSEDSLERLLFCSSFESSKVLLEFQCHFYIAFLLELLFSFMIFIC